jgi:hypothetical protein
MSHLFWNEEFTRFLFLLPLKQPATITPGTGTVMAIKGISSGRTQILRRWFAWFLLQIALVLWRRGGSCTFVILTSKRVQLTYCSSARLFTYIYANGFCRMYALYAKILDMSPGYTPCETISQLWILARGRFLFLKWSLNFHDGKRGRRWRTCF